MRAPALVGVPWATSLPHRRRRSVLVTVLVLAVLGALGASSERAPAARAALRLPLRIDTRTTLRQQFGYEPVYELNVPSFDPWNRPCIRNRTASQHVTDHVDVLSHGSWVERALLAAVHRDFPTFAATVNAGGYVSELVEFDGLGRAYTLLEIRLKDGSLENLLLYSLDRCASWRTLKLPFGRRHGTSGGRDDGTATMEHFTGWNLSEDPPLIAVWRRASSWPGPRASRNKLYVLRPTFHEGTLELPEPTLVTSRHLGMIQAAGGTSFAATAGSTSFIVWAEVAPPGADASPAYVAALDRSSGLLGPATRVGGALPANDVHDMPGICLDGRGYLHMIIGAHGRPFCYVQSRHPLDCRTWTAPLHVLSAGYRDARSDADGRGRQTYASLVCLPDDTLVLAFRQQRAGVDSVFAGRSYGALCLQRRPRDGRWSAPTRLVMRRDQPGYANFYQKLAVDRRGRLYLSLSYGDPSELPPRLRARHRYHHRMVLTSDDAGGSWRFARLQDYVGGVLDTAPEDPE